VGHYPVSLDISGRKCVIIGGGEVAERKARRLVSCGADLYVVCRSLSPGLEEMKRGGRLTHVRDDYRAEHLDGAFLAIGATDDRAVNERIFRDARKERVLINVVDDPRLCDVILPALCERGGLQIAVSTGGKSPALAKKLREDLEKEYGPEYGILLDIMGALREKILPRGYDASRNRSLFEAVVRSDILHGIRERDWKRVRRDILDLTGEDLEGLERFA